MNKLILMILLILQLAIPVSAMEFSPPPVPDSGADVMPLDTASFADGLWDLLKKAILRIRPDLKEAVNAGICVISACIIVSLLDSTASDASTLVTLTGTLCVSTILVMGANTMIRLGAQTVTEISEYGRLLLPVMTAALAAQGGMTSSATLYTGTALFDMIMTSILSGLLVPLVYLYLALSVSNSAVGEDLLKRLRDLVKGFVSWTLKTILTVFTTYISITGVVSGTTDAAALKATKVTLSSVVPVVGGILSDASEAVLVSAAGMKNAAGIYGILAILAIFMEPFLKIWIHYMVLKATGALCSLFGTKRLTSLVEDFGSAMGLLLAMTGAVCLMMLISTVCFMKGFG